MVKKILDGFIIAGLVILMIGIYYWMIKAGIPYQDPTTELQIRYAINIGIGEELMKDGAVILAVAIVGKLMGMIVQKVTRSQKHNF
ncbi:hypothetical protein [Butyrivibrio sp. MC2013]|uniref:hypothetical protein n=1 Tax=Butyrivibrio sp. MC2013 TaxID=1280686 RepID=UPI0003F64DE2|nr:hypothetical protein [Butyrivibrio sp. MC2013]